MRLLNNNKIYYALLAILILSLILCGVDYANCGNITLDFVYVGRGDAAMLNLPRKKHILLDSGEGGGEYDSGIYTYIKKRGVKKIDAFILSHYHSDHGGAVAELLGTMKVAALFLPALPDGETNWLHDEIIRANKTAKVYYIKSPITIKTENGVSLSVIYFDNSIGEENERSVVWRLDAGKTALFTGDIGVKTEAAMLAAGADVDSDILKVPHHGSKNSSSAAFLEAVSPDLAVICVGPNSYGHPAPETLARLDALGVTTVRTDVKGTYRVKMN